MYFLLHISIHAFFILFHFIYTKNLNCPMSIKLTKSAFLARVWEWLGICASVHNYKLNQTMSWENTLFLSHFNLNAFSENFFFLYKYIFETRKTWNGWFWRRKKSVCKGKGLWEMSIFSRIFKNASFFTTLFFPPETYAKKLPFFVLRN